VPWHSQAQQLFREFPRLGFLGAHRGRLDNGFLVDGRTNQISGPKFGTASDTGRAVKYKGINHFSPSSIPFMFVYKVRPTVPRIRKTRNKIIQLAQSVSAIT
jgi:hypothetical protein